MIDTIKFTNLKVIADRIMRHPLLLNVLFESIVQYTLDFLGLFGFEELYIEKVEDVKLENYRAKLPCGLIRINAVRIKDGICLKAMTQYFKGSLEDPAFKVLGSMLYSNLKNADLEINYLSMPVDEEGYPLILDIPKFQLALEAYIKKELFTIYFDLNKISAQVLLNALQDYAWRAGQLNGAMALPSVSEMQSISNMWNKMHLTTKDFYNGFLTQGNIDTYKIH